MTTRRIARPREILSKAKAIADEQGVEAVTLIVTGDPASVFVELSRNYNLIVIGNRGKGRSGRAAAGHHQLQALPAYAYCPIVVVPYTDDEGNPMHLNNTITKVAVGSDESKWGIKALEIAADFAATWDAELGRDLRRARRCRAWTATQGVMDAFKEDLDVRVSPILEKYPNLKLNKSVVPGSAVDALTKASHTHDVVVVGSRGRGGFTGLLFGSTSQGLLLHAVKSGVRRAAQVCGGRGDAAGYGAQLAGGGADQAHRRHQRRRGGPRCPRPGIEQAHDIESAIDPLHKR